MRTTIGRERVPQRSTPALLAWSGEALCGCLALLGAVATYRLLDRPPPDALWGLCTSAAVGYAGGWGVRQSRRPVGAGVLAVLLLVAVAVEVAVPEPWHHLLLDPTTWHQLRKTMGVPGGRALLAACVIAGVAAAEARIVLGRPGKSEGGRRPGGRIRPCEPGRVSQRRSVSHPALALLPALGLAVWSTAVAPGVVAGLVLGAVAGLGGAMILVCDACTDAEGASDVSRTDRRPVLPHWGGVTALLAVPLVAFACITAVLGGTGSLGA
ncbi:MAG TPA: hypothetical protein VHZ02_14645, partial [Acidimicrobiales bacterium]|nr:hypothetical protein [Acidimicrobiales bacterium]